MGQGLATDGGQGVVVSRQFGHAAHADAVAQARDRHLVALVHDGGDGRPVFVHDPGRDRIALHRIDRQIQTQRLGHHRRIGAERQDHKIGRHGALAGHCAGRATVRHRDRLDLGPGVENHAALRRQLGQGVGEQEAVAGFVMRQAQTPDEIDVGGGQARLGRDTARAVQNLARHAGGFQHIDVLVHVGQLFFGTKQLQRALLATVIGDAGLATQQVDLVAAVFGQTHHPALVQRIAFMGAVAQHGDGPAHHSHVQTRAHDQRGVAHQQPLHSLDRDRRRGPGRGIARRNLRGVGEAGFQRRTGLPIHHRDLMPGLAEIPGGGDADDARPKHQNPHVTFPSSMLLFAAS